MPKISAVIITFNEEKNIARCLDSIQGVVDEIIVVDSFSTDKTREICQKYAVTFIEHKFIGHIEQKNYAIDQATHDHILSLDADEALSDTLLAQIEIVKKSFTRAGYYFNRLTYYTDKPIYRCGWYPDRKLRLFKKDCARWSGKNPHDIIRMDEGSKVTFLKGDLLHYSYDSISDHIRQTNHFTTIAAKVAFREGARSSLFKMVTRPFLKFLKDYLLKRGFLDGRYGLIICYINALSAFLKYSKMYELQKNKSI